MMTRLALLVLLVGCSSGQTARETAPEPQGSGVEGLPGELLHPPRAGTSRVAVRRPSELSGVTPESLTEPDAGATDAGDAGSDGGAVAFDSGAPVRSDAAPDGGAPVSFPDCLAKPFGGCCNRGGSELRCAGELCRCTVGDELLPQGDFDYWCPGLSRAVAKQCEAEQ